VAPAKSGAYFLEKNVSFSKSAETGLNWLFSYVFKAKSLANKMEIE
jgi:hypothetical protein